MRSTRDVPFARAARFSDPARRGTSIAVLRIGTYANAAIALAMGVAFVATFFVASLAAFRIVFGGFCAFGAISLALNRFAARKLARRA